MFKVLKVVDKKPNMLTKDVQYGDVKLVVPNWAKYITTDKNGEVYIWGTLPEYNQQTDIWIIGKIGGIDMRYQHMMIVSFDGDASESLIEI